MDFSLWFRKKKRYSPFRGSQTCGPRAACDLIEALFRSGLSSIFMFLYLEYPLIPHIPHIAAHRDFFLLMRPEFVFNQNAAVTLIRV